MKHRSNFVVSNPPKARPCNRNRKPIRHPTKSPVPQFPSSDMGIVLGCLGIAGSIYKDKRDKKATKIHENYEPQPLSQTQGQAQVRQDPAVQDATRALQDEHLATAASPTNVERLETGEDTLGPKTGGIQEIQRDIAVEAPVPVPTA
jgi:hypothetical protein